MQVCIKMCAAVLVAVDVAALLCSFAPRGPEREGEGTAPVCLFRATCVSL